MLTWDDWLTLRLHPLNPDTRTPLSWRHLLGSYLSPLIYVLISATCATRNLSALYRYAALVLALHGLFCSSISLDLSHWEGQDPDPGLAYLNQGLLLQNVFFSLCVLTWTFGDPPRLNSGESPTPWDLVLSFRPFTNVYIPKEWRPTSSKLRFSLYTLASFLFHTVLGDLGHYHFQTFFPDTFCPGRSPIVTILPSKGLPTIRSSYLTLVAGVVVYCVIQAAYDLFTLIGTLILQQSLTVWPPVFDQPWLATSLSELWGRRWHQIFRHYFVAVGAAPARILGLPRVFAVMGVFTVSGILHWLGGWGMGKGADFWDMGALFVMSGVGVIVEGLWKTITDRRVGGMVGWVWTMSWMVWWANWLVDGWCRQGLIGSVFFPAGMRPSALLGLVDE